MLHDEPREMKIRTTIDYQPVTGFRRSITDGDNRVSPWRVIAFIVTVGGLIAGMIAFSGCAPAPGPGVQHYKTSDFLKPKPGITPLWERSPRCECKECRCEDCVCGTVEETRTPANPNDPLQDPVADEPAKQPPRKVADLPDWQAKPSAAPLTDEQRQWLRDQYKQPAQPTYERRGWRPFGGRFRGGSVSSGSAAASC